MTTKDFKITKHNLVGWLSLIYLCIYGIRLVISALYIPNYLMLLLMDWAAWGMNLILAYAVWKTLIKGDKLHVAAWVMCLLVALYYTVTFFIGLIIGATGGAEWLFASGGMP